MAASASPLLPRLPRHPPSFLATTVPRRIFLRCFSHSPALHHPQQTQTKSAMEVELTAPNGRRWTQPLGLFINNEFVKSSNDQKIASINPT
jgi:hypothetical protein